MNAVAADEAAGSTPPRDRSGLPFELAEPKKVVRRLRTKSTSRRGRSGRINCQ